MRNIQMLRQRVTSYLPLAAGLLFLFGIFVAFSLLKPYKIHDEYWHVDIVRDLRKMILGEMPFSINYAASVSPLYALGHAVWALPCQSLMWLRFPSFLFFLGNLWLLGRILNVKHAEFLLLIAAVVSGPWGILAVVSLHTEECGLFFVLLALIYSGVLGQSKLTNTSSIIKSHVALAILPVVRIYNLFIYPTLFCKLALDRRLTWPRVLLFATSLVPLVLLTLYWGGLTSPYFKQTYPSIGLSLNWSYFLRPIQMLSEIGLYLAPWWWASRGEIINRWGYKLWMLLIGCILVSFFHALGSAGPIDSILAKIIGWHMDPSKGYQVVSEKIITVRGVYGVGMFLFFSFVPLLWTAVRRNNAPVMIGVLGLFFYAISICFSGALFVSRYFFPAYVMVLIAIWSLGAARKTSVWLFSPFFVIGLAHAFLKDSQSGIPKIWP